MLLVKSLFLVGFAEEELLQAAMWLASVSVDLPPLPLVSQCFAVVDSPEPLSELPYDLCEALQAHLVSAAAAVALDQTEMLKAQ